MRLDSFSGRDSGYGPIRAEKCLGRGGLIGQEHSDWRSLSAVYISEQMAFIYILQRWILLEFGFSGFLQAIRERVGQIVGDKETERVIIFT